MHDTSVPAVSCCAISSKDGRWTAVTATQLRARSKSEVGMLASVSKSSGVSSPSTTCLITLMALTDEPSCANGGARAPMWASTHPNDQASAALPWPCRKIISGAMYCGVPCRAVESAAKWLVSRLAPKSATLATQCSDRRTLAGLRSARICIPHAYMQACMYALSEGRWLA